MAKKGSSAAGRLRSAQPSLRTNRRKWIRTTATINLAHNHKSRPFEGHLGLERKVQQNLEGCLQKGRREDERKDYMRVYWVAAVPKPKQGTGGCQALSYRFFFFWLEKKG